MKKIWKNTKLYLIGLIIGGIIFGISTVVADTVINSTSVAYESTTVKQALDDLFATSSTWIDPSYVDFGTLATNGSKTILASKNGLCIKRNNKVSCFKANNFEEEKTHLENAFSDLGSFSTETGTGCRSTSLYARCVSPELSCIVYDGNISCVDKNGGGSCSVGEDGTTTCTDPNAAAGDDECPTCPTCPETECNGKVNEPYFDIKTPTSTSARGYTGIGKDIFLAKNGDQISVCIVRSNLLNCFDANNYYIEKFHLRTVFGYNYCRDGMGNLGDVDLRCEGNGLTCDLTGSGGATVDCYTSSWRCVANEDGGTGSCWAT